MSPGCLVILALQSELNLVGSVQVRCEEPPSTGGVPSRAHPTLYLQPLLGSTGTWLPSPFSLQRSGCTAPRTVVEELGAPLRTPKRPAPLTPCPSSLFK